MFLISDEMKTFEFTEARAIYYRRIREGSAVTRKKKRKEVLANSCKMICAYTRIYIAHARRYHALFFVTRVLAAVKKIVER